MTSNELNFASTEKPRQIQANLIAYMRLFGELPDLQMVDDSETFWLISHKPAPGNIILRANWATHDPEKQIDALYEQIGEHLDAIDWFVFPSDQPADLGQRLEAQGMPGGHAGNWLWADLTKLIAAPVMPDNFHIEQVQNDQMMKEWTRISEAGFGSDELGIFYDAYARHGYGDDAFSLHYIGYLDDIPVTSGTMLDAGGCATVYDISTPPEFRGQGLGAAITHFMMQLIRNRGYEDTWIWSSTMGKKVYESLGYVDADFGLREHSWKK